MEFNKIIKKRGNSTIIVLSTEDLQILEKKVGDILTFGFETKVEQDRELEVYQRKEATQSYDDYVIEVKDAIRRGFNQEHFIMTKPQHKIWQSYFDKKTYRLKDKDKFMKWWESVVKEFRERMWNKKVIKK